MPTDPPQRRRRGEALDCALLDAAYAELLAVGYGGLTIDAVAARAGTSKPVLYRRWPNRWELVLAALRHRAPAATGALPDTGTLRGDVLELLGRVFRRFDDVGPDVLVGLFVDALAGSSTPLLEKRAVGTDAVRALVDRAMARGELARVELPDRVVSLPFDLARHEILLGRAPLPTATLERIVDEVFLPLLTAYGGT